MTRASAAGPDFRNERRRVVIDTDAANEIDDQFAIVWALLASEHLDVVAIHAAPYAHGPYLAALRRAIAERGDGPRTGFEELANGLTEEQLQRSLEHEPVAAGMERSFDEIVRIVDAVAPSDRPTLRRGATRLMTDVREPVGSEAVDNLIALAHGSDDPLYVAVLGAPTNVASALVTDPTIADKIVIVFVAGYPTASPHVDDSFNLVQDLVATNRIFAPDTRLVYIPGHQVAVTLSVSLPELRAHAHGPIGELLIDLYLSNPLAAAPTTPGHSWVMWDLAPIAWLIDPTWIATFETAGAQLTTAHRWNPGAGRITEAYRVDRRAVYIDLFDRLASAP